MSNTVIIGRCEDNTTDERASTELVHSISVPFEGGAIGDVTVAVFRSIDVQDRGGVVLKITLENGASSFIPFTRSIDSGVEIHMAGDIEAQSFIHALKTAIATL